MRDAWRRRRMMMGLRALPPPYMIDVLRLLQPDLGSFRLFVLVMIF
jgi:hypothetical protein